MGALEGQNLEMNTCSECLSEVPEGANVCRECGKRIVGKRCPECAEVAAHEATKCPFCGHNFARQQRIATVEPFSAKAAFVPTIFLRGRLIPQEIHLTPEKILIVTHGFFWLSRTDEEIPVGEDRRVSLSLGLVLGQC